MKSTVTTFLMFNGQAKEAMKLYTRLFEGSKIKSISYFDATEKRVQYAIFSILGQDFICIDSSVEHDFSFTPSVSLYVVCQKESEIDKLYKELSKKGKILMPLSPLGLSRKYAWIQDRFGVSWQLNFE